MSKEIPLTKGAMAIVDDADYDRLAAMGTWHLSDMGYAVRRGLINGKKRTIRMHRVVNVTPAGLFTDHINRNRLDNRKSNLRSCTQYENMQNRERALGVWYQKQNANWVVEIKDIHVGCFDEFELAYQIAQMIYDGELPLTRIKIYNPYCKNGHNKDITGRYGLSCKVRIRRNSYEYLRRKKGLTWQVP